MKKILDRIFKWFCNPDYYDDIRGDLEELYKEKQQNSAKFHANLYYLKEILLLLRMSLARPTLFQALVNQQVLLHSNFKTAFRYMWENKAFSFIKLSGLSLGIAATLVLSIYIQQQLSFDDFYPNKDRIYRVKANYLKEGFAGVHFPAPLAPTLVKDFPEIEQAGRLIFASWLKQFRPITQTQNFYESKAAMVDPELLDILDLIIIEGGDVAKSLKEPRTVLISHTKARKFFSGTSPMGKLLVINNDTENPYQVVGVFKDFPPNSHIQLDFMVTMSGVEFWPGEKTYWGANMYSVYALLREGVSSESVNKKLGSIIENYFLQSFKEREFANPEEIANNIELGLQPLQEIYLGSSEIRDKLKHGDQSLLWLFGISAILIVMIAIINFINLSIARYSIRLKELSMRKILGATRGQLIQQFLIESLLYSFLAVLLGLTIAYLALPYFGELIGQSLIFPISILWGIPIFFLAILVLGISTGTYPAIFLSNLTPRSQNLTARIARKNIGIPQSIEIGKIRD
ncbi:MAG: ABC transporter permease [Bacteroidota bacterium]